MSNIFQKFKRWLMDTSPEPDPIEYAQWETEGGTTPEQNEARVFPPRPHTFSECLASGCSTGPRRYVSAATGCSRLPMIGPYVVVDDDCLNVAAAAAVAAMLATESTPSEATSSVPSSDYCPPLEAPSSAPDCSPPSDCGGSCDCGGGQ